MHYVDEQPLGAQEESPTLLFVHGNPTWSFHWRAAIKHFRKAYRCVAPDHLGCGLSDKGAPPQSLADRIGQLIAFVEALDLQRVTLVAQDWGGAIGLGAMQSMPERLEQIVLFNTGAFPPPFFPWRIRVCRTPLLGRIALQGFNVFSQAALSMTTSRMRKLAPEAAKGYLAPYDSWNNRQAVYDFVADIPATPRHPTWQTLLDVESGLPALAELPVCLIWGMQDWCFRPECLERFLAIWPEARVARLTDVGHWVMEDAPEEAITQIESFLAESSASSAAPAASPANQT